MQINVDVLIFKTSCVRCKVVSSKGGIKLMFTINVNRNLFYSKRKFYTDKTYGVERGSYNMIGTQS